MGCPFFIGPSVVSNVYSMVFYQLVQCPSTFIINVFILYVSIVCYFFFLKLSIFDLIDLIWICGI